MLVNFIRGGAAPIAAPETPAELAAELPAAEPAPAGAYCEEARIIGAALIEMGQRLAPYVAAVGDPVLRYLEVCADGEVSERFFPVRAVAFDEEEAHSYAIGRLCGAASADVEGSATLLLENGQWAQTVREGAIASDAADVWWRVDLCELNPYHLANGYAAPFSLAMDLLRFRRRFQRLPAADRLAALSIIHEAYQKTFDPACAWALRDADLWRGVGKTPDPAI